MPKSKVKKAKTDEAAFSSAVKKLKARGPWPAPAEKMTHDEQLALNELHEWELRYEQKKRHARRMARLNASEAAEEGFQWPLVKVR